LLFAGRLSHSGGVFNSHSNQGKRAMKGISTLIAIVLAAALILPWASQARAQGAISFVSSTGNDANNCNSRATACASFFAALAKTADSGTISCADAGYFGSSTISKSVTIDCLAGGGGINAQQFLIDAAGKTVRLQNIAINGLNGLVAPIDIAAASQVYIENVSVTGRNNSGLPGIRDRRAGPAVLVIGNSSIVDVTGPGIVIAPASGAIGADLENVKSAYNTFGLAVGSGGRVTIKNSFFTNNSVAGIESDGGTFLNINGSQVVFNETGVLSHGSTTLNQTQILSNTTAISGVTQSFGNNQIVGNSTDGTAPTIISSR
jgi:hypothetical protein